MSAFCIRHPSRNDIWGGGPTNGIFLICHSPRDRRPSVACTVQIMDLSRIPLHVTRGDDMGERCNCGHPPYLWRQSCRSCMDKKFPVVDQLCRSFGPFHGRTAVKHNDRWPGLSMPQCSQIASSACDTDPRGRINHTADELAGISSALSTPITVCSQLALWFASPAKFGIASSSPRGSCHEFGNFTASSR